MAKRDYYESLGVHKNASDVEIKKAYRALAMRYHPDRNQEDKDAEAKFKEIAEAYEVLSEPSKRANYDQYGHRGEGDFGSYQSRGFDFNSGADEIFSEIFGEIFGRRRPSGPRPAKGSDLRYDLRLEFTEAVFGVEKTIEIPARQACSTCGGVGARPGTTMDVCPLCRGHGKTIFQQGFFRVERDCSRCSGKGKIIAHPCLKCKGVGVVKVRRSLDINIPPGVETGSRLRLAGEGEPGANGGPPGDLYVVLSVDSHDFFSRQGDDVVCELPITFTQAAIGAEIEVPTLDGTAKITVPPGSQHGAILTLRGKGIPRAGAGRRGNQRLVVQIEVPTRLSSRQVELLKEFDSLQTTGAESAAGRFWEKVKKTFA